MKIRLSTASSLEQIRTDLKNEYRKTIEQQDAWTIQPLDSVSYGRKKTFPTIYVAINWTLAVITDRMKNKLLEITTDFMLQGGLSLSIVEMDDQQ